MRVSKHTDVFLFLLLLARIGRRTPGKVKKCQGLPRLHSHFLKKNTQMHISGRNVLCWVPLSVVEDTYLFLYQCSSIVQRTNTNRSLELRERFIEWAQTFALSLASSSRRIAQWLRRLSGRTGGVCLVKIKRKIKSAFLKIK